MTTASLATGISSAAAFIRESARENRRHLHEANASGVESVFEELKSVWDECREANWDGYQALPVSQDAFQNAYVLLESLPLGFPAPTIGAEPDGQLTLEWHRSSRHTLSVSVDSNGQLHFAALLGPNRNFGTEAFCDEIPKQILDLARQVYAE